MRRPPSLAGSHMVAVTVPVLLIVIEPSVLDALRTFTLPRFSNIDGTSRRIANIECVYVRVQINTSCGRGSQPAAVTSVTPAPLCEMEPRSPSVLPLLHDRDRRAIPLRVIRFSTVSMRPVLNTMSSPALNVSVPATKEFQLHHCARIDRQRIAWQVAIASCETRWKRLL